MGKLYHGTNSLRYSQMLRDGAILPAPSGDQHVSLTTIEQVADYFASVASEWSDDKDTVKIILEFDRDELAAGGFDLQPFQSDVWGDGECEWECEVACQEEIPMTYATRLKNG